MAHSRTTFLTKALHRPVTVDIVFPVDKMVVANEYLPKDRPMKTLYFLEGLTGTYLGPSQYTRMQALAEDYNICVVMATSDNKWYADSKRTGDNYESLIAEDIVTFTRKAFRLSDKREDTYIGGFSMGGFGAANLGLLHADLFGRVIMISAALNKDRIALSMEEAGVNDMLSRENYAIMFGLDKVEDFEGCRYDYEANARKLAESGAERPKFFIGSGSEEKLLCEKSEKYAAYLRELGFEVERNIIEGTGHSWLSLEYNLARAFAWMQEEGALDGFRGNIAEYPLEANFSRPGSGYLMNWTPYYDLTK